MPVRSMNLIVIALLEIVHGKLCSHVPNGLNMLYYETQISENQQHKQSTSKDIPQVASAAA
jgi:hypothetical protein